MNIQDNKKSFRNRLHDILERPLVTNSLVLLAVAILVVGASLPFYINNFHDFIKEVLAEAHGMIFDIAIIGMLIYWLNMKGEMRRQVRSYKDEIDDFRLWESEEAAFRTAGNIKRLNRHKIYNLELVNCYLAKTNLNEVKLMGANLNYANLINSKMQEANLQSARLNQTKFENCNINKGNFRNAYANGAIFKDTNLIKSDFENAFLIKANFNNAFLMEANLQGAYLSGADFTDANLYKTDLRKTKGLTIEQLMKAKTLYLAKFDEELERMIEVNYPELTG